MIKEAKLRSPKWMRNFLDFEVNTGDDIKTGEKSERQIRREQKKKELEKWNQLWVEADEDEFLEFLKEEYKDFIHKHFHGYIFSSNIPKLRGLLQGNFAIFTEFEEWKEKKTKEEEDYKRIKKEINDLYSRLLKDFTDDPDPDKIESEHGEVEYTFDNGDIFKMYRDTIIYFIGNRRITYTIGLHFKVKFIELINKIVNAANRADKEGNYKKPKSKSTERLRYDKLKATIKLREEKLRKMRLLDPEREALQNELDTSKRMADKMKIKYQFEHLINYNKFPSA